MDFVFVLIFVWGEAREGGGATMKMRIFLTKILTAILMRSGK